MDLTNLGDLKRWLGFKAGGITAIAITGGGTLYSAANPPTVVVTGGAGQNFSGTPVISGGGAITGVLIVNPGYGFTAPTVAFTGGAGSGATATATADTNDTMEDGALSVLITAASSFIYLKTARSVLLSSDPKNPITETRDGGWFTTRITTIEGPVVSVASVTVGTTAVPVSTDPNTPGYGFDQGSIFLRGWQTWPGYSNVKFVYSAGYSPTGPEAAMLAQAANELVAQKYKRRDHIDQNSQSLQGQMVASFSQKDIPPEVQCVIDKFGRVPVFA